MRKILIASPPQCVNTQCRLSSRCVNYLIIIQTLEDERDPYRLYINCKPQNIPSSLHWLIKRHLITATSRNVAARTSKSIADVCPSPEELYLCSPALYFESSTSFSCFPVFSSFSFDVSLNICWNYRIRNMCNNQI